MVRVNNYENSVRMRNVKNLQAEALGSKDLRARTRFFVYLARLVSIVKRDKRTSSTYERDSSIPLLHNEFFLNF